jgi:hypothetical protein
MIGRWPLSACLTSGARELAANKAQIAEGYWNHAVLVN